MNNRRKLVVALGVGSLGIRLRSYAQQPAKIYRLGILTAGYTTSDLVGPRPAAPTVKAFLRGLGALGYVYGQHFVTEPRAGESKPERYAAVAAEVVRDQVDVIVAAGPWLPALKQATSAIPVVMAGAEDPLGQGLVRSLGRSGGNFTGLSNQSAELNRKRLELLKELVPAAGLVAVLRDPTGMGGWQVAEAAARERGWKLFSYLDSKRQRFFEGFCSATSLSGDCSRGRRVYLFQPRSHALRLPDARAKTSRFQTLSCGCG